MSITRAALRLRVARRLGLVRDITTSAAGHASGHTFVAESLLDHFPTALNELWVYEPTTFEERRIVNYDEPEGIVQVNRPFATAIGDAATLYLFRRFAPSAYDTAIEQAVEDVYPYLAQLVNDISLTTAANQYEYTIPATIRDLERMLGGKVSLQVDTGDADYPYVELRQWDTRRIVGSTSSYTLLIHPTELVAGRKIRIEGLGPLAYPASDSDTIPLDSPQTNLFELMVIANLYAGAQGAPAGDNDFALQMEAKYRAMYEQKKDEWGQTLDPTDLKPPTAGADRDLPIAYNAEPS